MNAEIKTHLLLIRNLAQLPCGTSQSWQLVYRTYEKDKHLYNRGIYWIFWLMGFKIKITVECGASVPFPLLTSPVGPKYAVWSPDLSSLSL